MIKVKILLIAASFVISITATAYVAVQEYMRRDSAAKKLEIWMAYEKRFIDCDLTDQASGHKLRYIDLFAAGADNFNSEESTVSQYQDFHSKLSLENGNFFIIPGIPNSIAKNRTSPNQISLIGQCIRNVSPVAGDHRTLSIGSYLLSVNHKDSVPWLEAAAEGGNDIAYIMLGHAYMAGAFGLKDELRAMNYYEKAARMGSVRGQYLLGVALEAHDVTLAQQYLVVAAKRGSIAAAYRLLNPTTPVAQKLSRTELYCWNLFYSYLETKTYTNLNDLLESLPYVHKYAELPEGTLRGQIESESSSHDSKRVKAWREDIERSLSGSERIAAQKIVEKLVASLEADLEADSESKDEITARKPAPEDPGISKTKYAWKKEPFAICSGKWNQQQISAENVYAMVKDSIWAVVSGNPKAENSTYGSAIAVSENHLLTNCHVISDLGEIRLSNANGMKSAKLAAARPELDACVLRVEEKNPSYASSAKPLADVRIGETSYSVGNPISFESTIADGIVSGIRKMTGHEYIQTTAPISPGSSGGALLDGSGNLLGITTFFMRGGQAINFAIPVEAFCAD